MRYLKAALISLFTITLVWALNRPWGGIPAFGPLLSPFVGFWQNAESINYQDEEVTLEGTKAPVTVLFDDVAVPHVFAQNDHDLYFAQGYLTARDRLWQMEFQTHAAAGRVSEIVGDRALELDRYNRHLGMGYGAEQTLKGMQNDPATRDALDAYTAGVNAWINQLTPAKYPIEYKLLGYAPEPWTPLKCALLLKQMTSTLASGADDLLMTNILRKYGAAVTADLFPNYPTREDPIIPPGTGWDFAPLPVPPTPKDSSLHSLLALSAPRFDAGMRRPQPEIGSNNWAVGAQKSATGFPILANDPHLTLSLPSIWYQIQLVSPTVNVYGASLPGAPNVIIGFNKDVAWGVTNVGADVLDFYTIRFKDDSRREYWHDKQWKPVRTRLETIKVKGKADVLDTVIYTHHGPVVYSADAKPFRRNIPVGHAARWIAHEPSNEMRCFYYLNRAKSFADYRKALTYYVAPAQNFIFASSQNDIAISPNGRYPLKYKEQGKFLLDGTNPADDWYGFVPANQNPLVKNPPRGFVSSANQSSTDQTYPYYINWEFAPSERGRRINQRLAAMQRATADSLRALQNDNFNLRAADVLPVILPHLNPQSLNQSQQNALAILKDWRFNNDAGEIGPTIFSRWLTQLNEAIWADEFDQGDTLPMRYPSPDRTLTLMQRDPSSRWFDNVKTPVRERLPDLVTQSFRAACDTLVKQKGALGEAWAWGPTKGTDIRHLLPGVDAFSVLDLNIGGGSNIVNATSERAGPSWRMVVALGPQPKAYGIYPGGQSGNPGSPYYQNMIETWRTGQLNELLYLQSDQRNHTRIKRKLTIK
ncbi:penicillin acylase family protein [Spirosoma taeanense]|uniref:Penicillin acylase family protein n=1 Tax=Spirosoma taeanense TaxID=2735870 RepID=A0A6M5YCR6_9BACT|nr:penicillin acylase family protein [Spirosoma taeanense]QJW91868.1 penicillin acylase family protein [Spirosoma taeanense]